jgi:Ca2+-binding EF-hand superfamily protein
LTHNQPHPILAAPEKRGSIIISYFINLLEDVMRKVYRIGFVILMVLAFGSGFAMAQGTLPVAAQMAFTRIDTNGDGVITVAEYNAYWTGFFKDSDADKDGKIMAAEFDASAKQEFSSMDSNKDGTLVEQEVVAYYCGPAAKSPQKVQAKAIKKIDADKNGKIEDDECVAFWMTSYNNMDTNKDRKVTLDEFLTVAMNEFKAVDQNGDGVIAVQELNFQTGKPLV